MNSQLVAPRTVEREALTALRALARAAYPREACGVLIGTREDDHLWIRRAIKVTNLAQSASRFELDPGQLVARCNEAAELGQAVLGIWHSHPDGSSELSRLDRHAAWTGWEQVVVAVNAESVLAIDFYRFQSGEWTTAPWREFEESQSV